MSHRSALFVKMEEDMEYRSSGMMTFVVSENGAVYDKDLGPDASTLVAGMEAFDKDATWRPADE